MEKLIDSNACAVLNNHDTHTHTHTHTYTVRPKNEGKLQCAGTRARPYKSPIPGATAVYDVPWPVLVARRYLHSDVPALHSDGPAQRGVQHTNLPSRQRTDSGVS